MVINKMSPISKDEKGAAIVIALIMMIVLTLIGIASTMTSTFEIKLSGNKRGDTDAFYAAESGINVIVGRVENFTRANYDPSTHKYDPFTDSQNVNVSSAEVNVTYDPTRSGPPRGSGYTAINLAYDHFMIASIGRDRIESSSIKSSTAIEEKVLRLLPAP